MIVVLIISLYTTRLVLNILGVEDYGIYNVVCGFVSMFTFLNTSMSNGIQRFFNYEYGKNGIKGANKVYVTSLFIQVLLSIVIVVLVETIGLWYLHNKMVIPQDRVFAAEWVFHFSVVSFLFIIMQAPFTAAVLAHEKMDFYAVASVIDVVLKLVIVFLLTLLPGDNLILYGILFASVSAITFIIYFCYCKRNFEEISFQFYFDKPLFNSMLQFSGWNMFGSMSGVMQSQGINLVLNYYFGPIVNAARGVAFQVNSGLQGFVNTITIPVRPQVVQSFAQGNVERTMHLTYGISKFSCCFLLMMAIPVSLEINYVLRIWLGDNIPEHTSYFTIIVLLTSLTSNLNAAISNVVHATGKMKHYQLWGSLVKICSVPVAFFMLLNIKIPEVALICVWAMNMLGHIVCLFVLKTLIFFSITYYMKKIFAPIFVVLGIGLLCTFPICLILEEGWWRLMIVIIVSVFSICLSSYFVALNQSERNLLKTILSSIINKFNKFNG